MSNPILDWQIQLDADEEWDLDLLIEHFRSDECTVTRDSDGKCHLTSVHFRDIQNHKEVIAIARTLMASMNGAAKVIAPWFQPVNSDKLTSVHKNGGRGVVLLAGALTFRMPPEIPPRETQPENSTGASHGELWVHLAKNDKVIADVLRIFGVLPPTWTNLYNVYELVREDIGGWETIVTNGWATKVELDRFRDTANDSAVIGDHARHQRRSNKSQWNDSIQPMTPDEAKRLLHRLIRCWLDSKTAAFVEGR